MLMSESAASSLFDLKKRHAYVYDFLQQLHLFLIAASNNSLTIFYIFAVGMPGLPTFTTSMC